MDQQKLLETGRHDHDRKTSVPELVPGRRGKY
jgi:hypothetical protein